MTFGSEGTGFSSEIETLLIDAPIGFLHEVARELASRLRLKPIVSALLDSMIASVARELASRLRLKL